MTEERKTIESLMQEERVFEAPPEFKERAWIKTREERDRLYEESARDPEAFWARIAEEYVSWFRKWDRVLDYSFTDRIYVKWFEGGKLNACFNCVDRHVETWRRNKAAIVWEGDDGSVRTYTYQQLYYEVNNFARVLRKHGVERGDRVAIYLPMVPELPIAMLACARIGAIHSVVFGGFSSQSLRDRINDSECKVLITADEGIRGGRYVPLKANADEALLECPTVKTVIVVQRSAGNVDMEPGRDFWWHEEIASLNGFEPVQPEWMDAEDPLFILYTSGSTGKPKGVIHTTGGYLVYTAFTHKLIFDYHDEDMYFCTADIGWITGHSYIVYGPLANGATSLMFEGVPNYPKPDRFWQIVEKHGVTQLYTAPTAIRALMKDGPQWADMHDMPSLKLLGTVGEPINPEAWMWYYKHAGKERCPIVDTWWQTETGGILISPLPAAVPQKPGSATLPMPGVFAEVVREDGSRADVNEGGYLCINKPWPGILRGTWGDPENARIKDIYFSRFPGRYFTGDGARVDQDGYFWLMGRVDDVINVSGHRIGTAEVESALVSHESVAEAAVVGFPHEIKGEGIYAYVILKDGYEPSDDLRKVLEGHVRQVIGPIAKPDKLQFVPGLPKTRSGKIMRRILRKIAAGDVSDLGDTTTLADPSVVEAILNGRL